MKTVYLGQNSIKLKNADLIQSGGEGMVFGYRKMAIKLYHQPQAHHEARLRYWLDQGLSGRLPATIYAPQTLVTDKNQQVLGFQMAKLPDRMQFLKKLANPNYCQQESISVREVTSLFNSLYEELACIHQQGVVVGDLNNHNLFWSDIKSNRPTTAWLDADSFQVGPYPCPVALQSSLDPHLYHIADFSQQPSFTPLTDWYAFYTLLIQSLLQVHPFGGVHHQFQSLSERAAAGITIAHPEVTYPKRARPLQVLSDKLLNHMKRIHAQGKRYIIPSQLLPDYADSLIDCAQCGLVYPATRPDCPACQQTTPRLHAVTQQGQLLIRRLLEVDGLIIHLTVESSGRFIVITHNGQSYKLIRAGTGGLLSETILFSGRAGYRFDYFADHLVVNPPKDDRLLLLDVSQSPQQIKMLETTAFNGQAVFACTSQALYRIAGTYLMRGDRQQGSYLETIVGTTHHQQTQLWASPLEDRTVMLHRLFKELHLELLTPDGQQRSIPMPTQQMGESLTDKAVYFSREATAFLFKKVRRGMPFVQSLIVDKQGQIVHQQERPETPPYARLTGKTLNGTTLLHPTDNGILKSRWRGEVLLPEAAAFTTNSDWLHTHPQGLLIQQSHAVYLVTEKP